MGQRRNKNFFKNILRQMKMELKHSKTYGYSKSSSKKEVRSNKYLPQETSLKQPSLTPQNTRKRTNEAQS